MAAAGAEGAAAGGGSGQPHLERLVVAGARLLTLMPEVRTLVNRAWARSVRSSLTSSRTDWSSFEYCASYEFSTLLKSC